MKGSSLLGTAGREEEQGDGGEATASLRNVEDWPALKQGCMCTGVGKSAVWGV